MTTVPRQLPPHHRHCEERSDDAIRLRGLRDMLLAASLDELDAEVERHILRLRGTRFG